MPGHTGCTGCAGCAGCAGHTGESRVSETSGEGGRGGEAHRSWRRDTAFPLLLDGKVTQGWIVLRHFHKSLSPEEPLSLSVCVQPSQIPQNFHVSTAFHLSLD